MSGLLYTSWTVTDGSNSEAIAGGDQVKFTGAGATTVAYSTANNTVTVTSTDNNTEYTAGTGLQLVGTEFNVSGIDSSMIVNGSVANEDLANSSVTVTAGTGLSNGGAVSLGSSITIDADTATTSQVGVVQLQDSATDGTTDKAITPNAVYDISGALQTNIDGKDNYTKWVLQGDGVTTTDIDSAETVQFTGAGNVSISLGGTDNRTVTISGNDVSNTYTAGSGLVLDGNEFNVHGGSGNFKYLEIDTDGTDDVLVITSTDDGSSAAPVICTMRDSASPADGDYLGQLKFKGRSDTGTERIYAKITAKTLDVTNGTEDGLIEFAVRSAGSQEIISRIRNDGWRIVNDNNLYIEDNGSLGVRITPTYSLHIKDDAYIGSGLTLPDLAPAVTTNKLYNNGGTLYFDGSGVDNDTTYTAGTGLQLVGTEFNVSGIDSSMIVDGSVANGDLANSSVTVTAGTGLSNGGAVSLGSSVTIDADTASTSQVGVVQLQDSATDGTTDKAITPNAVYDISGVLQTAIDGAGGASDLNDLGDVSYGGTNLSFTILINNSPGSAPNHGTLGSDNARNLGIGYLALSSITDASDNIVLGGFAGWQLTQGDRNVFVGPEAGTQITDGDHNICIGYQTQYYGNGGDYNIAIGSQALRGNADGTTTTNNLNNIGIGQQALYRIEDGDSNIAIGYKSANEVKDGQQNVAVGYQAQQYDESCDHNVAIGRDALRGSASSANQQYNVGAGAASLYAITTGGLNTAVGANAGGSLTTGSSNVFLGYLAGYGATATESDILYIGNDTVGNDGTIIKADMDGKHVAIGMADDHFSNSAGSATLQVYPKDNADPAILVKAVASPTTDAKALKIDDSTGTEVYSITSKGAIKSNIKSNTYGTTVTFDLDESNTHTVTLTGSPTLALSNVTAGQKFMVKLIQDGTGSHTVTWWSTIKWAGGTEPTLTTDPNKADTFGFLCTSAGNYDGFIVGQNI